MDAYFLYKLVPPRPTFALDMSEDEARVMGEHAAYWTPLAEDGTVVVFGPVMDPAGTWGMAVIRARDEAEVRALGDRDPAVTSGLATFEVCAMPATIVGSPPRQEAAAARG
jgi:uncharacterized protein YciI